MTRHSNRDRSFAVALAAPILAAFLGAVLAPGARGFEDAKGGEGNSGTGTLQEGLQSGGMPNTPFGDDTIGSLPIVGADDPGAVDALLFAPAPMFFIEGTPDQIRATITAASGDDEAFAFALSTAIPGRVRLHFVGEIDIVFGRRGFTSFDLVFGVRAGLGFGSGLAAARTAGALTQPSPFGGFQEHILLLQQLDASGALAAGPFEMYFLSQQRKRSLVTCTAQGPTVTVRQRP